MTFETWLLSLKWVKWPCRWASLGRLNSELIQSSNYVLYFDNWASIIEYYFIQQTLSRVIQVKTLPFHPPFSWWTSDNVGELNYVFCFCSDYFFPCICSLPSVSRNAGRYLLWISYQYKSSCVLSITKAVVVLASYSCFTNSVIDREYLRGVRRRLCTKWRPLLCVFQVYV